jgi:cohesin complex subunit SA-1/2
MTIHVLFNPLQVTSGDGSFLRNSQDSIVLEDEVQYRCAGFVQAEIERFAEHFEDGAAGVDEDGKSGSESSDDGDLQPKKRKKKPITTHDVPVLSNSMFCVPHSERLIHEAILARRLPKAKLEQEYAFMSIISAFLQALYTGAIHVRHGAVLLTQYGRLGPAFDSCTKALVEVLRVEGMYQDNAAVVTEVITQVMREVCWVYHPLGIFHP